jgi:hypothetical protein
LPSTSVSKPCFLNQSVRSLGRSGQTSAVTVKWISRNSRMRGKSVRLYADKKGSSRYLHPDRGSLHACGTFFACAVHHSGKCLPKERILRSSFWEAARSPGHQFYLFFMEKKRQVKEEKVHVSLVSDGSKVASHQHENLFGRVLPAEAFALRHQMKKST